MLPYSFPGVCNDLYIGETKKKVITRTIEHQQDSFNGKQSRFYYSFKCMHSSDLFLFGAEKPIPDLWSYN